MIFIIFNFAPFWINQWMAGQKRSITLLNSNFDGGKMVDECFHARKFVSITADDAIRVLHWFYHYFIGYSYTLCTYSIYLFSKMPWNLNYRSCMQMKQYKQKPIDNNYLLLSKNLQKYQRFAHTFYIMMILILQEN